MRGVRIHGLCMQHCLLGQRAFNVINELRLWRLLAYGLTAPLVHASEDLHEVFESTAKIVSPEQNTVLRDLQYGSSVSWTRLL